MITLGKVSNHQNTMLLGGRGSMAAQLDVNDSRRMLNARVIAMALASTIHSVQTARKTPLLVKYSM